MNFGRDFEEGLAHRVPGHIGLGSVEICGLLESYGGEANYRGEEAVRKTRHGVGLDQQGRNTAESGLEQGGTRHVTPHPQDHVGFHLV